VIDDIGFQFNLGRLGESPQITYQLYQIVIDRAFLPFREQELKCDLDLSNVEQIASKHFSD
jgi:hypothetical protein